MNAIYKSIMLDTSVLFLYTPNMRYIWYKNGMMIVESKDKEGRPFISSSITQEYFDDYIGNQKNHEGSLNLHTSGVKSLGKLESVEGYLELTQTNLTTLGNLKTVGGELSLVDTNITSLGNLESVGQGLDLLGTNLTSLGKLNHVGGRIYCKEDSVIYKLLMDSKFKSKIRLYE